MPCAGIGERAGADGPKQYTVLAGHSVVSHTLKALAGVARLRQTLVVLSPHEDVFESRAPSFTGWVARVGGASRAESVAQGLNELVRRGALAHDWVLVHDAARCLVRAEWVDALIDACVNDEVGGLLALPVADTLKHEWQGGVGSTVTAGQMAGSDAAMFRLSVAARVDWQAP